MPRNVPHAAFQQGFLYGCSMLAEEEAAFEGQLKTRKAAFEQRVQQQEGQVAERESEITSIMQSVNELAQVMRDLSVLVIDQGTILDRIDYNLQETAAHIDQGVVELEKAEKHQKASKMFLCIMLLAALCILMILVLAIKKIG